MYKYNNKLISVFLILFVAAIFLSACSKSHGEVNGVNPPNNQIDSSYVTVNGNRMFYREAGKNNKTAVILIHGWPLSSKLYQKNIPALAKKYHVIAPDLPGYGKSKRLGKNPKQVRVSDYAKAVLGLMKKLNIKKAVIGGMSMGGPTVLSMYKQSPDSFIGMILIDTDAFSPPPQEKQLWMGWATNIRKNGVKVISKQVMDEMITGKGRLNNPKLGSQLGNIMKQASKKGAIAGCYALGNRPNFKSMLGQIDVPVLITVGLQDTIYPFEIAKRMKKNISNAQMHIIKEGAHAATFQKSQEENKVILAWLSGISSNG
jgi:pimeloyl-ACP methyl ester carboxylesterase